jgi:beta-lactamase regulating signal transducer with metallopeptidase domain
MTPVNFPAAASLLVQLVSPAARAIPLAVVAGLLLTAFRIRNTSQRLFTWTAVLYAALAMPLLAWIVPSTPVPIPAILPSADSHAASAQTFSSQPAAAPITIAKNISQHAAPTLDAGPQPRIVPAPSPNASTVSWETVALGLYLAVASLLLGRFLLGLAFTRRLLRSSERVYDARARLPLDRRAHAANFRATPPLFESAYISVPLTIGALRSAILLPAGWREWDDAKLDAVLAHELSHVARRDGLTQRVALIHRAIFWFSPLAWWLDHHLSDLAEAASDEAALAAGASRTDYARTLLGFFTALQSAPGRVRWQGVAMAKPESSAVKRVERILSWAPEEMPEENSQQKRNRKGPLTMRLQKTIALIAVALPVIYFAASVHAAPQHLPLAPAFVQNQTAPSQTEQTQSPSSTAPEVAPEAAPPVSAIAPEPRASAQASSSSSSSSYSSSYSAGSSYSSGSSSSYSYGYSDEDRNQRYVIVSGKSDALTMSGDMDDAHHVEKLRQQFPGDFIWFQRDEKSYIIRDQATIDRARKLFAPEEELSKQEEALSKQEEELSKQQEALSEKIEEVKVTVPDITAQLDKLKAKLVALNSTATVEQIGEIQSEIGELQSRFGEVEGEAGQKQGEIGRQQGELGRKQGELGRQQGEIGRRQGEIGREANRQMRTIFDEAIKNHTAQPEP